MNRVWPYPHKNSDTHPRGTKRTRPPHEVGEKLLPSDQSDQNDDDVDVPLSKRINRLNIEYSTAKNPDSEKEAFKDKYPYDATSTYYRNNELLYNLHEERTQRSQQAVLHKALSLIHI